MEVDEDVVMIFKDWEGKGDPQTQKDDDNDDNNEPPPNYLTIVEVPKPPEVIAKIYEEATPDIAILKNNLQDQKAISRVDVLNTKIENAMVDDAEDLSARKIPTLNIIQLLTDLAKHKKTLTKIKNLASKGRLESRVNLLIQQFDAYVLAQHYPRAWLIQTSDETSEQTIYPWPIVLMRDGGRIVGVRKAGFLSFRLIVE